MSFSNNRKELYIQRKLIELAYKNNLGGLIVNSIAAIVVYWLLRNASLNWLNTWVIITALLMAIRFIADFAYRLHQRKSATIRFRHLRRWQLVYRVGLTLAGVAWAFLVLKALPSANEANKFSVILIICALASGGTAVLAADKFIGKVYISCLLLSGSLALLLFDQPFILLAMLGVIFLFIMFITHTNNHYLLLSSLELTFQNETLLAHLQSQNDHISKLNQELEGRVTERTAALERMACTDSLTQLLNRSGLIHQLSSMLNEIEQFHVYFLDLDKFKQINDSKGHEIGDQVLKHITKNLSEAVPKSGILARWGGDEFVFCLPGEQCKDQVLNLISNAINDPINIDNDILQVGVTIGYAIYPDDASTINGTIGAADLAATQLKKYGRRGELLRFNPAIASSIVRKTRISELLATDGLNKHFYVEYQPIVNANHDVIALEALCRLYVPELGSISPDEFINIAEENGRINELGLWVFNEACLHLAKLVKSGLTLTLSVNVSPVQMKSREFPTKIQQIINDHGLPNSLIALEITESFLEDEEVDGIIEQLNHIVDQGINIYIDDFGKGYSSLSRLRDLPVRTLKIDRSFIASLDEEGDELIESILYLANKFGLNVIAEGVETQKQFDHLKTLGCHQFQGFFFGRPTQESLTTNINDSNSTM